MQLIKLTRYLNAGTSSTLYLDPEDISWISGVCADADNAEHSVIALKPGGALKVLETPDQIATLTRWFIRSTVSPKFASPNTVMDDLRAQIQQQVVSDGRLEYLRSSSRNASLQHYRRKTDNKELSLQTYVVKERNKDGVCFFTVRSVSKRDNTDWIALYAAPLGRIYLMRRSEIISENPVWRDAPPSQLTIILRDSSPLTNLLHDRVGEFVTWDLMPTTSIDN